VSAAVHLDALRPVTRADCADGPRPCPWTTCRHHLLIVAELVSKERFERSPQWAPGQRVHPAARTAPTLDAALAAMPATCVLDVTDAHPDGLDLREAGALLGISGEGVRLIERRALAKLQHAAELRKADRDG